MKTLLFSLFFFALATTQGWAGGTEYSDTIWTRKCTQDMKCVAFHPNSQYIATGGNNAIVDIWETSTGNIIKELTDFRSDQFIYFSSTGKYLVFGGGPVGGCFKIISFDTYQTKLIQSEPYGIKWVSFSPNEKFIAVSSICGFRIWEIETGKLILKKDTISKNPSSGNPYSIGNVLYSPDGTHIIFNLGDGTLRFYNIALDTYDENYNFIAKKYAFSRDGTKLAFVTENDIISIMDVLTGKTLGTINPSQPFSYISNIQFFNNDNDIIIVKEGANAEIWQVNPIKLINDVNLVLGKENAVISNDNNYIAYIGYNYLSLLSVNSLVFVPEKSKHQIIKTLFPNPSSSNINITTNFINVNKINILDENGKLIKEIINPEIQYNNNLIINTNELPSGIYFIQVISELQEETYKLIINK